MPSTRASSRDSTAYRLCNERNGGAIESRLAVTLSIEWHRAQFVAANARPRKADGDGDGDGDGEVASAGHAAIAIAADSIPKWGLYMVQRRVGSFAITLGSESV